MKTAIIGLLAVVLSQVIIFVHIRLTLKTLADEGSRFMEMDAQLATDPGTPEPLRTQLAHPAFEWMSLDGASRQALLVILSREDQLFAGRRLAFDPKQFADRAWSWITDARDGDPSGSTIPQQVAKNLFTKGERSAWRKAYEAVYAAQLNELLTKRQMLEIYINVIEFGPGIYGLCAASFYYFDKSPAALTRWDMSTLVGLMPSPKTYTIYPTSPTVLFARHNVDRYIRYLRDGTDPRVLRELVDVRPRAAQNGCREMPQSLVDRLAATTSGAGVPAFAGDQWWWARVACQFANGVLPPEVRIRRSTLAWRAAHTPCNSMSASPPG